MHITVGRPQADHQRKNPIAAEHGEVLAAVARLEGGGHRAFGLRQPEQGGAVLRPHFLGPQRQPVRAHRQHDGQPRGAVPVLEPVSRARPVGPGRRGGGQRRGGGVGRRGRRQVHAGAQGNIRRAERSRREYILRIQQSW